MRLPTLSPIGDLIGATVEGVDLSRPLDGEARDLIEEALAIYCVLIFRDQHLTVDRFAGYGRAFGRLLPIAAGVAPAGTSEEVLVVTNVGADGKPGSLGARASDWHSDLTYVEDPPAATCQYAVEMPTTGGEMWMISCFDAYERLPSSLKRRIEGMRIGHDATTNSVGALRAAVVASTRDFGAGRGAVHPLVRTDPLTGRRALALGRRAKAWIEGMERSGSEDLLDELWEYGPRAAFPIVHQWRAGDLLHWDNRWVMRRREPFPPQERRIMWRLNIAAAANGADSAMALEPAEEKPKIRI